MVLTFTISNNQNHNADCANFFVAFSEKMNFKDPWINQKEKTLKGAKNPKLQTYEKRYVNRTYLRSSNVTTRL